MKIFNIIEPNIKASFDDNNLDQNGINNLK